MTATAFFSIVLVLLALVLLALLDLVRATEMDPVARVIVAAALILMAPLGLLLWLFVRGGRTGAALGAALLGLAVFALIGFAVGNNHTIGVERSGASFSVSGGQPIP